MLLSLPPWRSIILVRQGGSWNDTKNNARIPAVQHRLTAGLGLAKAGGAPVFFTRSELPLIVAVLFVQQSFGMCMWDDTYAIPDHGKQLLKTSHHEVIWTYLRPGSSATTFVRRLAAKEFTLPKEVPDGTFTKPEWMH